MFPSCHHPYHHQDHHHSINSQYHTLNLKIYLICKISMLNNFTNQVKRDHIFHPPDFLLKMIHNLIDLIFMSTSL